MYIIINIAFFCYSCFFVPSRLSFVFFPRVSPRTHFPLHPPLQRAFVTFCFQPTFFVRRSSFVVSFLSTRGNLERTPLSNCFSIWFPVLGSRFICVRGFCPRGDPFVRQLRIPFVVGNKIGSYKLFLVSIPGTRGSSPFVPSSSNVSVTFPRVHSSPLLFLSFFFFLQPKFLPFVIFFLFPVIPVPHLIYCFRSAIINN